MGAKVTVGYKADNDTNFITNEEKAEIDAFLAAGPYTLPLLNVLGDAGTMSDGNGKGTTGSFQSPTYFSLSNSSTLTEGGAFSHNNTNFGGSGSTMNDATKRFCDKFNADAGENVMTRYGIKWFVGLLTLGSGTGGFRTHNSEPYYLAMYQKTALLQRVFSGAIYLEAVDDDILVVKSNDDQILYVDDVEIAEDYAVITPAMGVVKIRNIQPTTITSAQNYNQYWLRINMKSEGDRVHFAAPSLMFGVPLLSPKENLITTIDALKD